MDATLTLSQDVEEEELEYSSDSSYHDPPSADPDRVLMVPVSDLEVHVDASEPEIPSDTPMERGSTSAEERSMSPLHIEEEHKIRMVRMGMVREVQGELLGGWEGSRDFLRIEEETVGDLMSSVLEEQPMLPSAVSGARCKRSSGGLQLKRFHPYSPSAYFLGNLRGLPATEEFRQRYFHWGRGPMETSEYIVNTLKTLVQFTWPFTTRYILGTFQMLLCHLPNMLPLITFKMVAQNVPKIFPAYA